MPISLRYSFRRGNNPAGRGKEIRKNPITKYLQKTTMCKNSVHVSNIRKTLNKNGSEGTFFSCYISQSFDYSMRMEEVVKGGIACIFCIFYI